MYPIMHHDHEYLNNTARIFPSHQSTSHRFIPVLTARKLHTAHRLNIRHIHMKNVTVIEVITTIVENLVRHQIVTGYHPSALPFVVVN